MTGVGVGVGGYKATSGMLKSIAPGRFGGGQVFLKYELGQQAYELGFNLAEAGGFNEPRQRAIGGAAFGATYVGAGAAINKSLNIITDTIWRDFQANYADGMLTRKLEAVREESAKGARKAAKKSVMNDRTWNRGPGGKFKKTTKGQMSDEIGRRTEKLFNETMEKHDKKMRKKIKSKMTKKAARKWDDIAKTLIKDPKKTFSLARYLGEKNFRWLGTKLAASTSAVAFPEVISSIIGLVGYGWLALDIFKIMEDYPKMGAEIDNILRGSKAKPVDEENLSNAMAG